MRLPLLWLIAVCVAGALSESGIRRTHAQEVVEKPAAEAPLESFANGGLYRHEQPRRDRVEIEHDEFQEYGEQYFDQGYGCADGVYDEDFHDDSAWELREPSWLAVTCSHVASFFSRHSSTHGRAIGYGQPLRGTSWLNRPYEVNVDFGALIMTGDPATNVRRGNDFFTAIQAGWDWDHYWGTQVRAGWSTPELVSTSVANDDSADNLFIVDGSIVYYPWGDSKLRPYYRLGMGLTDIEFTNQLGRRQHELMFTIPMGLGVKYAKNRWLAWRAELANNLAIGSNEANTLNNITLTFGLEGRFGGRPNGYWAYRGKP